MVLFTVIDVIARKISWLDDEGKLHGVQVFLVHTFGRMFESTMLQELEPGRDLPLFGNQRRLGRSGNN